jgi:hypothetical protein
VRTALVSSLVAAAFSCAPSPIIRPTVPPEPIGVINDTAGFFHASSAVGLETGLERELNPRTCVVIDPPTRGVGDMRVVVRSMEQRVVLDLAGTALRDAWSACDCGGRRMPHCVRVPQ